MGNCEACLSGKAARCSFDDEEEQLEGGSDGDEMVKVLRTTDNELFEFPGPVSVRDLLFGFQGFAVYPQNQAPDSRFKSAKPAPQRPLHPDTLLKLSHLYYLKPLVNPSLLAKPDDTKDKQSTRWLKPTLIKPFFSVGTYSLTNTSDKDLLLVHEQVADTTSSAESSTHGVEKASYIQHMPEAQATIDAQPLHALPEASLALHAHDRTSIHLTEGVFTSSDAQERPSSFDQLPIDQSFSSQTIKKRKVRFSDEVQVIPSSNYESVDSASTSPTCSPRYTHTDEEAIHRCKERRCHFDKQAGLCSASKEEVIPHHMSKTELKNGVVRLKMVISKKQLAELVAARVSGDQCNNALMEKMLVPFLTPTPSSCHRAEASFHGGSCASPSWKPSLHHIPESHPSLHELF